MGRKPYLKLDVFLKYHNELIDIPTWTNEKKSKHESLIKYINSSRNVRIISSRDSPTGKVYLKNSFTIFKVRPKQRGKMIEYRNKWVLMYVINRRAFQHYLLIFPLKDGINAAQSKILKKKLGRYYRDSINE